MTSLIFGVICIYLSAKVLLMPEEAFRNQLNEMTKPEKPYPEGYFRFLRGAFLALGILGAAMVLLRFF